MTTINNCEDFQPWTHSTYEEAGCAGCALFIIYTDADIECQVDNVIRRKMINCKAFGLAKLVIKDDG